MPASNPGGAVAVTLDVKNTGDRDGDEVVRLYVSKANSVVTRPIRKVCDFARVNIPNGTSKTVSLQVRLKDVAYWHEKAHKFVVEPGAYEVQVGASAGDIRVKDSFSTK